jgi:hypothetical protein
MHQSLKHTRPLWKRKYLAFSEVHQTLHLQRWCQLDRVVHLRKKIRTCYLFPIMHIVVIGREFKSWSKQHWKFILPRNTVFQYTVVLPARVERPYKSRVLECSLTFMPAPNNWRLMAKRDWQKRGFKIVQNINSEFAIV